MSKIDTFEIIKKKGKFNRKEIKSSLEAAEYIRQFYGNDIEVYESFFLLLLNRRLETIGYVKISQGGITGTIVDRKIVLKYILDSLATQVIIAHNHPSGNLSPSESDKLITKDLNDLIKMIDSELLDHLIITADNGFYSFKENGLL
jgi:DNA repair protein RadC